MNIENDEVDRLARELAAATGESITQAVLVAIRERLDRERTHRRVSARLARLADEIAMYPIADDRTADEILGYDERGVPS